MPCRPDWSNNMGKKHTWRQAPLLVCSAILLMATMAQGVADPPCSPALMLPLKLCVHIALLVSPQQQQSPLAAGLKPPGGSWWDIMDWLFPPPRPHWPELDPEVVHAALGPMPRHFGVPEGPRLAAQVAPRCSTPYCTTESWSRSCLAGLSMAS